MENSQNVKIPEVEDVYEALGALELSQNNETRRVTFAEAEVQLTTSPFATPRFKSRPTNRNDRNNNSADGSESISSPLTTYRLKPISERIRGTNVSIGESGAVCLELFKQSGLDTLTEMFTVSQDGLEITICQFCNTTEVTNDRREEGRRKVYTLDNLPKKFNKKYEYCRRFVNLVKSKTPKVIIYNQQAKCMLMENFPDPNFMAKFYNGQTFISTWQGMKLVNQQHGSILSLNSNRIEEQFSTEILQLVKFAEKCHKQCLELEGLLKSNARNCEDIEKIFPVILGRKKSQNGNNEAAVSHSGHIAEILNRRNHSDSSDSDSDSHINDDICLLRQVTLPNIGHAKLFSSGDVKVDFKDGCHMKFNPTEEFFTFIDNDGVCHQFNSRQKVPDIVRCKIVSIPNILHQLNTQNNNNIDVSQNSSHSTLRPHY
ncbi:hypothetical protein LOTGIDRAFT_231306 [Lottia gigantea]|uniref:Uncharacterized protein n=1 Tax=Lottia gigantea TaxID=225164 RepID=V4AVF2_LOTGI|nr:hypothetical protein LOTGIDRAFT_231306 [Lottia gigantea]ESO98990.1 hypothetical protein LOTGIDRAFT_231306 [Lottia gigantea]